MKVKKRRISKSFLRGLVGVVLVAILATTAFLWIVQTGITKKNAYFCTKFSHKSIFSGVFVTFANDIL
jgi:hypothetical protein